MSKTMTLEVLSSIKGAQASEAVDQLFEVIKKANLGNDTANEKPFAVKVGDLREDVAVQSGDLERTLIRQNFPLEKNGYLVVAKVIEE
ncbi:hypothetical protein LAG90_19455 [Marinilongibacter aquaticus]|uniref:hypothetical protein n=1 Tax=Marinilongibacter aquaticus TaxID=2975157 RepID=UPI0021BD95FF|nr:hypothetical protein [Marinilongibacter aquaticus]UBM58979.1 hypothetical protein LAG90_19455 [Marinilongibacter aquaticus]